MAISIRPPQKQEQARAEVLQALLDKTITTEEAAKQLSISRRQLFRLKGRYLLDGPEGLIHQLCGTRSNRRFSRSLRKDVLDLIKDSYADYGPTLLQEVLLSEHAICVSREWLRRLMIEKGLWSKPRKKRRHRKKRQRRQASGALVQFDGSDHLWFEDRGPRCCLLLAIDDATSDVFMRFARSECTEEVLAFWMDYVTIKGIPQELYTDFGSVYYNNHHPEQLTDFGRAMQTLGTRMIFAHSPQAKGRVERAFRTLQDRLVKALRRNKIGDVASANRFLQKEFLPQYRKQFSYSAANGKGTNSKPRIGDVHRRCRQSSDELKNIFCFQQERHVYNDYTITLEKTFYQIKQGNAPLPLPRSKVLVRRWLDGSLHISSVAMPNAELAFELFSPKAKATKKIVPKKGTIPAPDHAWRNKPIVGEGSLRNLPRNKSRR